MDEKPKPDPDKVARCGIDGLDDILKGGFTRGRMYLVEGVPGAGKTSLAMQFLLQGIEQGEATLYVTLSETAEELTAVAASHGWDISAVSIRELLPDQGELHGEEQYTMYHPSEVELAATTKVILDDIERLKPSRVVIDSLSELRLIAGNALRYRRQLLALKQYFSARRCTVIVLDDMTTNDQDLHVHSIVHGVIQLEHLSRGYGAERRRLRVIKYRATSYRGGYHDYLIAKGGLKVFPRLVAAETRQTRSLGKLSSSIAALDQLTGGGIEEGTSTLIVGGAGTGKSTIAAQYCVAAARRGQKSIIFMFDESPATLLARCDGLSIDLQAQVDAGLIETVQVDPAELSPGQFAHMIRDAVERTGVTIVVIDSLNGYLNAMPEDRFLTSQLHEMLMYLAQHGIATLLISAQRGLMGANMQSPVDASYLADAVMLLRYFESRGEVRQAISVVKKRGGSHERTIREFSMRDGRIGVGDTLKQFRGILSGTPVFETDDAPLVDPQQ